MTGNPGDMVGVGAIEHLARLQQEYNAWAATAEPWERAAVSRAALAQMPGQAYLFARPGDTRRCDSELSEGRHDRGWPR